MDKLFEMEGRLYDVNAAIDELAPSPEVAEAFKPKAEKIPVCMAREMMQMMTGGAPQA